MQHYCVTNILKTLSMAANLKISKLTYQNKITNRSIITTWYWNSLGVSCIENYGLSNVYYTNNMIHGTYIIWDWGLSF